jgi:methylated-DNA-[protein]-cysteine S-methyltransferase
MRTMNFSIYESPIGPLTLIAGPDGLRGLHFPRRGPSKREADQVQSNAVLAAATEQLDAYFAGELRNFELDLDLVGTMFQRRVWAALREIPYGSTTTYGTLAHEIGVQLGRTDFNPRAVGAAVGRTPVPIIVPCHRVIGSDGSLTGYGGGLHRKRALLDFEGGGGDRAALDAGWTGPQLALL